MDIVHCLAVVMLLFTLSEFVQGGASVGSCSTPGFVCCSGPSDCCLCCVADVCLQRHVRLLTPTRVTCWSVHRRMTVAACGSITSGPTRLPVPIRARRIQTYAPAVSAVLLGAVSVKVCFCVSMR